MIINHIYITHHSSYIVTTYLWSLGFLEIANDGKVHGRKESIIDDFVILPTIASATDVIVGFLDELGTFFEVQSLALNIVKFKGILFKDTTDSLGLDPQECGKNDVKATSKNANQRRRTIRHVCCIERVVVSSVVSE